MFENRTNAGELLREAVQKICGADTIVLALPRGGVPVAAPIAKALGTPLAVLFVKKIGAPGHAELAIGAVVDGGEPTQILNREAISALNVSDLYIAAESDDALRAIEERRKLYAGLCPPINPDGAACLLVDDGLATGASMEAAIKALRKRGAKKIIVAVPVAPAETVARLRQFADEIICLKTPTPFGSVGSHYKRFDQVDDSEVMEILNQFNGDGPQPSLVRRRA